MALVVLLLHWYAFLVHDSCGSLTNVSGLCLLTVDTLISSYVHGSPVYNFTNKSFTLQYETLCNLGVNFGWSYLIVVTFFLLQICCQRIASHDFVRRGILSSEHTSPHEDIYLVRFLAVHETREVCGTVTRTRLLCYPVIKQIHSRKCSEVHIGIGGFAKYCIHITVTRACHGYCGTGMHAAANDSLSIDRML